MAILKTPLSTWNRRDLSIAYGTPIDALPLANALMLHATASMIKASKQGYLPDAPKGEGRLLGTSQYVMLLS